jgi:Tfp pilus assembly protein PilV
MKIKLESRQGGFSLVEVIVATVILTFGLLAMAASTAYTAAQLNASKYDTARTQAKSRMVEALRARTYASVATRSTDSIVGGYNMKWNVTAQDLSKRVELITSGNAYRGGSRRMRTTVVDTMTFEILSP